MFPILRNPDRFRGPIILSDSETSMGTYGLGTTGTYIAPSPFVTGIPVVPNPYNPYAAYNPYNPYATYNPYMSMSRPSATNKSNNKFDIIIGKNATGSILTDDNITYLKTKINILNKIYNIIFKHLCHKKNVDNTHDFKKGILSDFKKEIPNYMEDFCLGTVNPLTAVIAARVAIKAPYDAFNYATDPDTLYQSVKTYFEEIAKITSYKQKSSETKLKDAFDKVVLRTDGSGNVDATDPAQILNMHTRVTDLLEDKTLPQKTCSEFMFDDSRLDYVISKLNVDPILNKACAYMRHSGEIANVQLGGSDDMYIDIAELLKENDTTTSKQLSLYCIETNGKMECSRVQNNFQPEKIDFDGCQHCNKWAQDRYMFKNVIKDLLTSEDINTVFNIINGSSHLLPSAILKQKQYEDFFTALEAYKQSKN